MYIYIYINPYVVRLITIPTIGNQHNGSLDPIAHIAPWDDTQRFPSNSYEWQKLQIFVWYKWFAIGFLVGFNPSETYDHQIGSPPPGYGWKLKISELPPPSFCWVLDGVNILVVFLFLAKLQVVTSWECWLNELDHFTECSYKWKASVKPTPSISYIYNA